MIPIIVAWMEYTVTANGRVVKLVPCDNCHAEYVDTLEREAVGVGTSLYGINEDGTSRRAVSSADQALREYLANDLAPVPCPACEYYQRFMFPEPDSAKSAWSVARLTGRGSVGHTVRDGPPVFHTVGINGEPRCGTPSTRR